MNFFTTPDGEPRFGRIIGFGVPALIIIGLIWGSFYTVQAGDVAVVTRLGRVVEITDSGFHIKVPFIDLVRKLDKRTQSITFNGQDGNRPLAAASKDLQDVTIEANINFQINPSSAEKFVTTYREDYRVAIIEPIVIERVKTFSAQYTAEELVTKRAAFSDSVAASLTEALATKDVILTKFSITNFSFSPEFTQAIERKTTADQDAQTAKNKTKVAEYEADALLIRAEGNAKAAKITAEAVNNNGGDNYIRLKEIEVQGKALDKWNGVLPTQMIPGSTVPFINLSK